MADYRNIKPLIVSARTYNRIVGLFGDMKDGSDGAMTKLLDLWEMHNGDDVVDVTSMAPLSVVNHSHIDSVLIEQGGECVEVPFNGRAPSWNSLVLWVANNLVMLESTGWAYFLGMSMHIPKERMDYAAGLDRIAGRNLFVSGGATVVPATMPKERGWMEAVPAGVMIRILSAPQAMRLLRRVMMSTSPGTKMTIKLQWANRPGAAYPGRCGRLVFRSTWAEADAPHPIDTQSNDTP